MDKPFEREVNLIKTFEIKNIVEQGLALVPEYFYKVPASSTGKYHPKYALGEGGLYRHVKAIVIIATELFRNRMFSFTQEEQDIILASIILHDCWKQGLTSEEQGTSIFEHPVLAANVLKQGVETSTEKQKEYLDLICENISSHMGEWNTSRYSTAILPTPVTRMQEFVHLCDYIASRKQLEVVFD